MLWGNKINVKITEDYSVDGYYSDYFEDSYYVVTSIELPCKIVIHKSWIKNGVCILPNRMSYWLMSQMNIQLPLPLELFDA